MVKNFDPNLISTRSLQMDTFSLDSYGRRSIHIATYNELFDEIRHFISIHVPDCEPHLLEDEYLRKVLDFLLHNEENFSHLAQLIKPEHGKDKFSFLFTKPHGVIRTEFDRDVIRRSISKILSLPDSEWTVRGLQKVAQQVGLPYKKLFHLFRMAMINNDAGPPVMELVEFFGVAECRKRLQTQMEWLSEEEVKTTNQKSQCN